MAFFSLAFSSRSENLEKFHPRISASPRTATATAQLANGFVVSLTLTDGGSGYITPPDVTISGGGGIGATAIAHVSGGRVIGLIILSAGIGYTSAPQVRIAPPAGFPLILKIESTHIQLKVHVVLGRNYRIETSQDKVTWAQLGNTFYAHAEDMVVDVQRAQLRQYLRIYEVPN